jgi:hypothetical protein
MHTVPRLRVDKLAEQREPGGAIRVSMPKVPMTPEPAAVLEARKVIGAITEIDMPFSVDKCESYMCDHWKAKAAVIVATYAAAQREARDEYWKKWVDEYNRTLQDKTAQLAAAEGEREMFMGSYERAADARDDWENYCTQLSVKWNDAMIKRDALQAALVVISNVPCGDKYCNAAFLAEAALTGSA